MVKRSNASLKERRLAAALYHARQNRLARLAGGGGGAAATIGTTNETGFTLETTTYNKRGNFYTVTENRKILTVAGRFTQSFTVELLIAEINTGNDKIITILIDQGEVQLTSSATSAPGEVLEFDISNQNIVFEVGKAYAVVFRHAAGAGFHQYRIDEGNFPVDSDGVMIATAGRHCRTNSSWAVNVDLTALSTDKWIQEITHEAA